MATITPRAATVASSSGIPVPLARGSSHIYKSGLRKAPSAPLRASLGTLARSQRPHSGLEACAASLMRLRGSNAIMRRGSAWRVRSSSDSREPFRLDMVEIMELKVKELREELSALGLPTSGLKSELQIRLIQYMQGDVEAAMHGEGAQQQQQQQESAAAPAAASARGERGRDKAGAMAEARASQDHPFSALSEAELHDRISLLSVKALGEQLKQLGTPAPGAQPKAVLVALLAAKVSGPGTEGAALELEGYLQGLEPVKKGRPKNDGPRDVSNSTVRAGMTVVELREELSKLGVPAHGTKARLRERLASVLAEQRESGGGAQREHVTSSYKVPIPENVESMTVLELREALSERSLTLSGAKSELVKRLQDAVDEERTPNFVRGGATSPSGSQDDDEDLGSIFDTLYPWAMEDVDRMTEDELREGLSYFGLQTDGDRPGLVGRLWPVLELEAKEFARMQAEGALGGDGEAGEWGQMEPVPSLPPPPPLEDPTVVAVICGGPSEERGISLASARTIMDSLQTASRAPHDPEGGEEAKRPGVHVLPFYIDRTGARAYQVSAAQLYSHTPEDFESRLSAGELPLEAPPFESLQELAEHLKGCVDVVFPAIHGDIGESGELAGLLEAAGVPFVGTPAKEAAVAFNKGTAGEKLQELGYPQLPQLVIPEGSTAKAVQPLVSEWCSAAGLDPASALLVVKPTIGGSSIGVSINEGAAAAAAAASELIEGGHSGGVLVQQCVEDALEFAVCVIETKNGPIALLPTEVEMMPVEKDLHEAEQDIAQFQQFYAGDELPMDFYLEDEHELPKRGRIAPPIYDYSLKYLPSTKVHRHVPARLKHKVLESVRAAATRLFKDLGLRDFARIDGWVLPGETTAIELSEPQKFPIRQPYAEGDILDAEAQADMYFPQEEVSVKVGAPEADLPSWRESQPAQLCETAEGTILFTDINIISGMEQASFLFQQASAAGLSHSGLLRHLYNLAAERHGVPVLPPLTTAEADDLAVNPYAVLSKDAAAAMHLTDDKGNLSLWTPPPDHAWDHFRTELEEGTATMGLWQHDYLPNNQACSPFLDSEGSKLMSFPLGWTVHPKYLNTNLHEGRMHLANYEALHPEPVSDPTKPLKVWVLMGGETSERQVSLMSGINVWLQLRGCHDVIAEPFVLSPPGGNKVAKERRQRLLKRRNYFLQMGLSEDEISRMSPQLSLAFIQNPPSHPVPMEDRGVWAVPEHLILRQTVEEVNDACRDTLSLANRVGFCKDEILLSGSKTRTKTQAELADAKVDNVAAGWGDDPYAEPPAAEKMCMAVFAKRARLENAVVFLATHGGYGEDGELQGYLEDAGIPFTGSNSLASQVCMDKIETARALESLEAKGISTAPKEVVNIAALANPNAAAAEYTRVTGSLPATPSLCIKPAADGCSTGVARISNVDDFVLYGQAISEMWPRIPANSLSVPHPDIEMPAAGSGIRLLVEPFIETDPVSIAYNSETGSQEVEWAGLSRWTEVTIGIVGEVGHMHALTPSITVLAKGDVLTLEEKVQSGTGINLTPPPPSIATSEALTAARQRCELIADVLGLSGVARIDAFMHADTGELVVIEVNTIPAMTPHTVLLHQALQEEPPMYPQDLFRSVVELALLPPADPSEDSGSREDMYLDDETWYGDSGFGQQGTEAAPGAAAAAGDDWGWASPAAEGGAGSWGDVSNKDAESAPGSW